jgi:hypothetical protein
MNDLYEILEICLQDIERGESIETVLFRYPEYAAELRPILEGSVNARSMAIMAPSAEVVRRNRAKVLQHAAQMREAKSKSSSRRMWFASLRWGAVTLAVVAMLFVSGTGLVSAASTTLPGDNLYPVKRTWEDVVLMLTFNLRDREALEIEHENNRLHEVRELFVAKRPAEVEFSGVATGQNGNEWIIAGIRVLISDQTEVRDGPLTVGNAVRVKGQTQGDGVVLAERVRLLAPDEKLPDEDEIEQEGHDGENHQGENNSGKGPGDQNSNEGDHSGSGSGGENSNSGSSNSGSGSESSGSGSEENNNDSSGSGDNSGSGQDDNSGSNNNAGEDNSSNSNDDSGGHGGGDSGSGGGDNSGSGGGGGDGGGGED